MKKKKKKGERTKDSEIMTIQESENHWIEKKEIFCTFFIALLMRLSPTGIRTPPKMASTAPMTAPVRSPQLLLQVIPLL